MRRTFARLHHDERGTISIVSVFALLMFTMLLIMIVNVGTHLDDKLKMQNAADASGYSGGVVLARGMNAIAFTNHLLSDVFAVTAFLREARDRNAEQLTPEILDEWQQVADTFQGAPFEKFARLGSALQDKVPQERGLVGAFGNLSEAAAVYTLPVFESILEQGLISEFQRNLVRTVPQVAQQATAEIARRHALQPSELRQLRQGQPAAPRGRQQTGVLWRTSVLPVGFPNEDDPMLRTLPAVDPDPFQSDYQAVDNPDAYLQLALRQRRELAKHYLEHWNSDKLRIFDREAELSQLGNLWRIFTCANLDRLLTVEYPVNNLPMVLRQRETDASGSQMQTNEYLERDFMFLSVAYAKHRRETGPGVFRNPLAQQSDAQTFAQISLFLPRPRMFLVGPSRPNSDIGLGGTYGFDGGLSVDNEPREPPMPSDPEDERWARENWPQHWDLLAQNWTIKIVPATARAVPEVLQAALPPEFGDYRPARLGDVNVRQINRVNTH